MQVKKSSSQSSQTLFFQVAVAPQIDFGTPLQYTMTELYVENVYD